MWVGYESLRVKNVAGVSRRSVDGTVAAVELVYKMACSAVRTSIYLFACARH